MKHVLKILKKSIVPIIFIMAILVLQALLDLSLPTYTSDIVNNGIVNYGITNSYPDVIRESEYNKLTKYLTNEEKDIVGDSYNLIEKGNVNYINEYSALNNENIYLITDKVDSTKLNTIMKKVISINYLIENNMINLNDLSKYSNNKLNIDETLLNQVVLNYIKEEYVKVGIDIDTMQIHYVLSSGLRMLGVVLLIVITAVIISYLSSRVAAKFGRELRNKVVSKVMSYSEQELKEFSIASLITRSTNDIQNISNVLTMIFRSVVFAPIMGIGAFIKVYNMAGHMSWVLGLGIGAVVFIIVFLLLTVLPKTKILQSLIDKVNLVAREILTGLPVIRTFNTEKYEDDRFDEANTKLTKTNLFVNRTMSMMMPTMTLVLNMMCILIIWVGAGKVNDGLIGVGDLLALIQYSMHVIFSFLMVALLSVFLPRTIVSLGRIGEILNKDSSILDKKHPKHFPKDKKGYIEFKDVSFRYYDGEEDTLSNISFTAKPGEVTAIIGSTGSGKSTLINLIPRFYDVTSGSILVDGIDIRDVKQKDLRDKIGLVPQKGVLFSGTIESNIKFGEDDMDFKKVEKASIIAQAKDFITEKEDNYNSPISQGGKNVSGGQKQRLAIARAVAKNPEIYIFDDSFSALDYKTDSEVRKNLRENTKGSTIIIVTQRVSTVLNANQIIVLDEGKMVGIGTHKELLNSCEIYKEIAKSQLGEGEL